MVLLGPCQIVLSANMLTHTHTHTSKALPPATACAHASHTDPAAPSSTPHMRPGPHSCKHHMHLADPFLATHTTQPTPSPSPCPAGHWYHAPCIDAWLKRNASCPLCKKVVWRPLPSDALPLWHELLRLGLVSPDFLLARSNSSRGRRGASQSAEGGPGGDGSGRGSNRVGSGIGRARSFIGV